MKPIKFKEVTTTLNKPSGMTDEQCSSLPVYCDGVNCVSCWRASFIERIKIALTGKVYVGVMSGNTQPPIFVAGESVFVKKTIKSRFKAFFCKSGAIDHAGIKRVVTVLKQPDKCKHLVVGFLISFIIGILIPWLGLSAGIVAGAIKEWVYDKDGHGTVEVMDFICTCIGAIVAFPFAIWIHFLIF